MRVLLVDDHRLLIEGLSNLLAAHGIEVLGIASDGLEAVAMAQRLNRPDFDGCAHAKLRWPLGDTPD
jgi:DNA-binding NarL/FixJ family response regulator